MEHTPHEEIYYNANGQKDYLPLLKDPSTPAKMMEDIVDRISTLELKKLAFQHPNISQRSVRYVLEKADKKPYQQELIEYAFNYTHIDSTEYQRLKDYYNKAGRLQTFLNLSIQQNNIFPERMTTIATMLNVFNNEDMKIFQSIILNDNCSKEAFAAMFDTIKDPIRGPSSITWSLIIKAHAPTLINHKNFPQNLADEFFKNTGLDWFLSDAAKDVFLF